MGAKLDFSFIHQRFLEERLDTWCLKYIQGCSLEVSPLIMDRRMGLVAGPLGVEMVAGITSEGREDGRV